MKPLNKTATNVFMLILARLQDSPMKTHLKLDQSEGAYMPLHVEFLYHTSINNHSAEVYSLSHYYRQNGDLVPDPDMTFAVLKDNPVNPDLGPAIFALSYQDSYKYDQAAFINENDRWQYRPKLQADITAFAHLWLKNIKEQQDL